MAVRCGMTDLVYIMKFISDSEFQTVYSVGDVRPMLSLGMGKAMLSAMTDEEIRTLGIEQLPQTMGEALEAFEGSTFAREVLGDHIYTKYLEAKSAEWKKFRAEVTDWEVQEYLYKF